MRVYGLKNCDKCRAAMKALTAAGHAPDLVDVRADGLSEADLDRFVAAFGADLVNRRSTTWRGLAEAERARPARDLLNAHPALMKRPVIAHTGGLTLGWDAAARKALLG